MLSYFGKKSVIALAALLLTLPFASFSPAQTDTQELTAPTQEQKIVSRVVAQIMEQLHLSKLPLDDTIGERAFKLYVDGLDPTKRYFVKADIDEFKKMQDEIDDRMEEGDFSIALDIFKRFLQRVDERTDLALELIDTEHDFTIDEKLVTDPDLLDYAESDQEIHERWRKFIKYSLLVLQSDDDEAESDKDDSEDSSDDESKDDAEETSSSKSVLGDDTPEERLRKRYRSFARRMHQMDTEDVVERYVTAITSSFDPHTSYMSRKTFENFMIIMGLELEGIGATLAATDDGYTVIKNIVPGGAAATQGGLKVEDKIVAVGQGKEDGTNADVDLLGEHGSDFVDVTGMRLDDVVAMIRGKAGTTVRLSVMSENDAELHTVMIVREKIKLEDSAARGKVFEQGTKPDGSPRKIGVIELPSFYANMERAADGRSTTTDVRRILDEFNSKGVDALVLDLRKNGGGSLQEAIDCTGLFISSGPVVQVKDPTGAITELNDEDRGQAWQKPMVVLTSKFSASASEILAGAVQDYGRGLIIGDSTTHGKGTVQSLRNLSEMIYRRRGVPNDFGALKITTQQFYRPNGDSTQKRGVLSDVILPSITDKMDNITESDLDYPVEFDRVPRASFSNLDLVNEAMIDQLKEKSAQRVADSDKFQEEIRKINKYVEQKGRKWVSLNKEQFLARRRELNSEKEDEETLQEQISPNNEIELTFYLEEVLQITADYMKMLKAG